MSLATRQPQAQDTMRKKRRQLSGYESSSPEDNCDDDEIDETFLALQKLLKALNNTRQASSQVVPVSAPTFVRSGSSGMGANGSTTQSIQEEMLELRRRERERFRHMLFSKNARRARVAHYQEREDEDEDEEPVMSVESTISNRVISGSFSRLNVHVISRDRWSEEEVERLPIVLLPKNGKVVSPADNPKLNVCPTKEHEVLRDQLIAHLQELPHEDLDDVRLLTPPQSTWYIQMRDMDGIQC